MQTTKENPITSGKILKPLILFALPLLGISLLQNLYNMVDSIVVGQYLGGQALAAVGSSSSLIFLVTGFFQGIATGAGVNLSYAYGAQDWRLVKKNMSNALLLSFFGGILITMVVYPLTPHMLRWMLTPEDIFEQTNEYLKIYILSIPTIAIYNTGASIMRSMGDSQKPLILLAICSVVNLVLDLLFVVVFNWGVAGVAWATLIAQLVSAVIIMYMLMNRNYAFALKWSDYKPDFKLMKDIIKIGLPVAIQSSAISFANVLFQSQVNIFGSTVVAGYAAGSRITGFIYMPCSAFGLAATTFVGQNVGAKQYTRIKDIARICMGLSVSITVVLSLFAYAFAAPLLSVFTNEAQVISIGTMHLVYVGLPTFLWSFQNIYGSVITGLGKSFGSMVVTMANMCGVRLLWIFSMLNVWYDVRVVFLSYPVSWVTAGICMLIYYTKVKRDVINPNILLEQSGELA